MSSESQACWEFLNGARLSEGNSGMDYARSSARFATLEPPGLGKPLDPEGTAESSRAIYRRVMRVLPDAES